MISCSTCTHCKPFYDRYKCDEMKILISNDEINKCHCEIYEKDLDIYYTFYEKEGANND